MDGSEYQRKRHGLKSRFTAKEIAQIRDVYDRCKAAVRERSRSVKAYELAKEERRIGLERLRSVRDERSQLLRRMKIHADMFSRIGRGALGKNPRD